MPLVAQVSDLHLSPRVPERQAQAELVLAGINQAKPDLTVVTGDLTDDGWDRPDDLVWAKQWMDERLDGEWFAVPGNHDVGNFANLDQGVVTEERVSRWNALFGASPWVKFPITSTEKLGLPWVVLGINSMTLGSGLPSEESDLDRWVEQEINWRDQYAIALFLHSPLFHNRPDEQEEPMADYWLGPTSARHRIMRLIYRMGGHFIASGHVHQTKLDTYAGEEKGGWSLFREGADIVWAPPASGTWVHAPGLPNPPAPERTGFVLHHLGEDGSVRSEVIECAPMLKTVFYDPTGAE